jgi:DNA modification methylase
MKKVIEITLSELPMKEISEFKNFQGHLKKLSTENYKKLKESFLKRGFNTPIFVWKDNDFILDGHARVMALRDMMREGYSLEKNGIETTKVPYIEIVAKDKKEAAELVLQFSSKYNEITEEGLKDFIKDFNLEISDIKMSLNLDINLNKVEFLASGEAKEDDFDVEAAKKKVKYDIKPGEVWKLGEHRLMCGDSTKSEDVGILMQEDKINMVLTDPPYNIDYKDLKGKHKKIENDAMGERDFIEFIKEFLLSTANQFHKNTEIKEYLFCNWKCYHSFYQAMSNIGHNVKSCIVWDKERGVQNLDKYYKQHEFILYHGPFGGQKTLRGDIYRLNREKSDLHPTMKPVQLCADFIQDSSEEEEIIFDGFGGSGSTLIAAEQLNRRCLMMEIDPIYCSVIIERWEKLTSKKAEKL